MPPPPVTLTFDLLTLKWCPSRVTYVGYLCANFSLHRHSVLDLGLMYATDSADRQIDVRLHNRLPPPTGRGGA